MLNRNKLSQTSNLQVNSSPEWMKWNKKSNSNFRLGKRLRRPVLPSCKESRRELTRIRISCESRWIGKKKSRQMHSRSSRRKLRLRWKTRASCLSNWKNKLKRWSKKIKPQSTRRLKRLIHRSVSSKRSCSRNLKSCRKSSSSWIGRLWLRRGRCSRTRPRVTVSRISWTVSSRGSK